MKYTGITFTLAIPALITLATLLSGCSRSEPLEESPPPAESSSITESMDLFSEPVAAPRALSPTQAVAKVNGIPVLAGEVQQELTTLVGRLRGRVPPERIDQQRAQLEQQALSGVINRRLLLQAMEKEKIDVPEQAVDERIADLEASLPPGTSLNDQLARSGQDMQTLRESLRTDLRLNKLLEQNMLLDPVSENEVSEFYNSQLDQFRIPRSVAAHHLMIAATGTAVETSKMKLNQVRSDIEEGASFDSFYRQPGAQPEPGEIQGADLRVVQGQLPDEIDAALFALAPGELSSVLESPMGVHLFQVVSNAPARTASLEEARESIQTRLTGMARQQAFRTYLEELRAQADIQLPTPSEAQ